MDHAPQQPLVVYYQKKNAKNQKRIEIPDDPCPVSYILDQIIKQDSLQ